MPEVPEEMKTKGRPALPFDDLKEMLYRRVPPAIWEDDYIELDAIELPDMSVNRGSLGPPQWARLADTNSLEWGVIGFQVGDLPPDFNYHGIYQYSTRAEHSPLRSNYPHSEVRAYEVPTDPVGPKKHINAKLLAEVDQVSPDVYQRWREYLRRRCQVILKQGEIPFEQTPQKY